MATLSQVLFDSLARPRPDFFFLPPDVEKRKQHAAVHFKIFFLPSILPSFLPLSLAWSAF
jgi:hypothetical protein